MYPTENPEPLMNDNKKEVSLEDFRAVLTPENVTPFMIIYISIATGTILFAALIGFLHISQIPPTATAGDSDFLNTLSVVHFVLAIVIYLATNLIYNRYLKGERIWGRVEQKPSAEWNPVEIYLKAIREATIIRLALFEGVAMFGLVICLLGVMNGVLQKHPIYWLNLLSTVVLLLFVGLTFPRKEYLEMIFRYKFGR